MIINDCRAFEAYMLVCRRMKLQPDSRSFAAFCDLLAVLKPAKA